jgi:nicotinate-nucleotide adenylyltransferase
LRKLFKKNHKKIGILGGTFDPAHIGHIKISREAKKKFKLDYIIWAITKKNPFKNKSKLNLNARIKYAKKITKKEKFIKIEFFENKIKSNKTINLINYFKKINKKSDIYFIMGADNLINFHKWHKWKSISQKCSILVFDRQGYKAKSLKSITFKHLNQKSLEFIKLKKVNISSSQLRKI